MSEEPLDRSGLIGEPEVFALGLSEAHLPILRNGFSTAGIHGSRLARAAASQANLMSDSPPKQLLHALSRYGVWAQYAAEGLETGALTPTEAAALLYAFAAIQEGALASYLRVPPSNSQPAILVNPSEQEMDLLFAEEMFASTPFFDWLTTHAKAASGTLVSVGRSQATVHGETDLLVLYDTKNGERRAILIEDKIAAVFMPNQDGRYRRRIEQGKLEGQWTEGLTLLIAPQKYLDSSSDKDFDARLSYEAVASWLENNGPDPRAAFKIAMLRAATAKASVPWVKTVDDQVSSYFENLIAYARTRNPELPIPVEEQERAPTSNWIVFSLPGWPKSRIWIEMKPHNGVVDLRLRGITHKAAVSALSANLRSGMAIDPAARSVAIRLSSDKINMGLPLATQIEAWDAQLDHAKELIAFAEANSALLLGLLDAPG